MRILPLITWQPAQKVSVSNVLLLWSPRWASCLRWELSQGNQDHMVWEKTSHSTCSVQPLLDPLIEITLQSIHILSTAQTCTSSFLSSSSQLNCLPAEDGPSEHPARVRALTPELSPQLTGPEIGHHPHLPITHSLHPHSAMSPPPLYSNSFRQFRQMNLVQLQTAHHPSHHRAPQRSTTWECSKDTHGTTPGRREDPALGVTLQWTHILLHGAPSPTTYSKVLRLQKKNTIR